MKLTDIISMAVYNLWSRKGRTVLNLIGIVISCVMLTMMLAGTRGAREGVFDIMNASDQTKQFMIFESYDTSVQVPAEELKIPDGVSEDRRDRLIEGLERSWRARNAKRIRLDIEQMERLRSIEDVATIAWQNPVRCNFVWSEGASSQNSNESSSPKPTAGSLIGIDPLDQQVSMRMVAGQMISEQDEAGVMVDEFTAYNLGYRSDEQMEELIGTEVEIRCSLKRSTPNAMAGLIAGIDGLLDPKTIQSLQSVAEQLDRTDLADDEKAAIRSAIKLLPKAKAPTKKTEPTDLPPDIQVDKKGNQTLVRKGIVRGVLKQSDDDDLFGFLQFTNRRSRANLYIHHTVCEEIQSRKDAFVSYGSVAGRVANVSELRGAIDQIEAIGFRTRSAISIVEKLEREVGKVRLAVGALALLILLVAAVGICNTMVIAVLERTTEFGVMKSIGAEDRQVLAVVLFEGLVTGLIGAAFAILVSMGVAELVSGIARTLIEERLKGSFDQPVFRFHPLDSLIVFGVAIAMCVMASLIPAWRAAKLDPIDAMKRT